MIDKELLETANWQVAHTWSDGLELEYADIELGDLSVYSLLSVLGRITLPDTEPAVPNA